MIYTVEFSARAAKQFHTLPKNIQQRLIPRIDALGLNPRPSGVKQLSGVDHIFRLRIGDYRVLYQIHDRALVILVVEVGHRREVYRRL